jgi:hypothetical protein
LLNILFVISDLHQGNVGIEIAANEADKQAICVQFQGVERGIWVVNSVCPNLAISESRRYEGRRVTTFQNGFNEAGQLSCTRRKAQK